MKTLLSYPAESISIKEKREDQELKAYIYHNIEAILEDNHILNILNLFIIDKTKLTKDQLSKAKNLIINFIQNINNNNFIDIYSIVYFVGKTKAFWDMMYKFKNMKVLEKLSLEKLFKKFPKSAYELTCYDEFYHNNKEKIHKALLQNHQSFEYFESYIFKPSHAHKTYLESKLMDQLANNYVECNISPRSTFLHMVEAILHPSPKSFRFSDSVRLKAFNKLKSLSHYPASASQRHLDFVFHDSINRLKHSIFSEGQCGNIKYKISFPYLSKVRGQIIRTVYIDKNSLLFKNGIKGAFLDLINLLNLLENIGINYGEEFESREIKHTPKTVEIILSDPTKILLVKLIGKYIKLIKSRSIDIEKIFEWYYRIYINQAYNIKDFEYTPSQPKTSFYSKCINLCVEIEKIIRQFRCLISLKDISRDYLRIETLPVEYSNIPSFIVNKYYYINLKKHPPEPLYIYKDVYNLRRNTLADQFSDFLLFFVFNCPLMRFIPENQKTNGHYKYISLEDIFTNFNLKSTDIPSNFQNAIKTCFAYNLIFLDSFDFIRPNSAVIHFFLNSGLCNDPGQHISYYYSTRSDQEVLDKLIKCEAFLSTQTLLTNYEQMYFDYILKNNLFPDGLNLRNQYLHGMSFENHHQNRKDYLCILSVMVLLLFKINQELSYYSKQLLVANK